MDGFRTEYKILEHVPSLVGQRADDAKGMFGGELPGVIRDAFYVHQTRITPRSQEESLDLVVLIERTDGTTTLLWNPRLLAATAT